MVKQTLAVSQSKNFKIHFITLLRFNEEMKMHAYIVLLYMHNCLLRLFAGLPLRNKNSMHKSFPFPRLSFRCLHALLVSLQSELLRTCLSSWYSSGTTPFSKRDGISISILHYSSILSMKKTKQSFLSQSSPLPHITVQTRLELE